MKINFGKVPHQHLDEFGDGSYYGPDKEGNFYYFQAEFGSNPGGTEDVLISDTCGRQLPIGVAEIASTIKMLTEVSAIASDLGIMESVVDRATAQYQLFVDQLGNPDIEGFIDDFNFEYYGA